MKVIGFVGCGYVADLYIATLENWTDLLRLKGVYDANDQRAKVYCEHYDLHKFDTLDDLLADPEIDIVVNLTNPSSHYDVTKAALEAGKHVYSEKPIALDFGQAKELADFAAAKGLQLAGAPSSVLGEAAQALIKAVDEQVMGQPHLVYAELDDGMIHKIGYERWITESGAKWPAMDEFETGCTLEHAGYVVSWMVAMFGPVRRVVSFAKCIVADKGPDTPQDYTTPDFTCACLEFDGGVVARVTNSTIAPHDHRFRVHCSEGHLSLEETWDFKAPVWATPVGSTLFRRALKRLTGWETRHQVERTQKRRIKTTKRGYAMDFSLGIAELAMSLEQGVPSRLNGEFSLHITEVSLAIQHPEIFGTEYIPTTSPSRIAPMSYDQPVAFVPEQPKSVAL